MKTVSCLFSVVGSLAITCLSGLTTQAAGEQVPPQEAGTRQDQHLALWYDKPANDWSGEALPIGNGRMGAMLFGGAKSERIQFNENSLWSGDNNWDGAYDCGEHGFGCYRNFGDLFVEFGDPSKAHPSTPGGRANGDEYSAYRRELDIATGIHTTTFSRMAWPTTAWPLPAGRTRSWSSVTTRMGPADSSGECVLFPASPAPRPSPIPRACRGMR